LIVGTALSVPANLATSDSKTADASCRPAAFARAAAAAVLDGRTVRLDDGREVRLAGLEAPLEHAPGGGGAAGAARDHLQSLVADHPLVLRGDEQERDRYGRLRAQVYAVRNGTEHWVQGEMVAAGHARVAAGGGTCSPALLSHERAARAAALGLWSDPYYGVRRAEQPAGIAREQGRFAIVEGDVLSVRESGGTIYVNFGRRWSEDFTVTIAKRNERVFTAAGLEPKRLDRRRVRVRGWIEARGGPLIEAVRPEQIEVVERR
jgi:endonuclease YncB( thermonuclease family)